MVALLQSAPRCPNKVVFPFNAAWGMFQMFCFYFRWFAQVLEDGNGAGGANSPREAGSSDELWAQMQVLLIANLKNSLSCDFQNNRQTMQCWRLHEALQCQLEGPGSTSTETIFENLCPNVVPKLCEMDLLKRSFLLISQAFQFNTSLAHLWYWSVLVYQPQTKKTSNIWHI